MMRRMAEKVLGTRAGDLTSRISVVPRLRAREQFNSPLPAQ